MRTAHNTPTALIVLAILAVTACETRVTVSDIAVALTVSPGADTLVVGDTAAPFRPTAENYAGDTIAPLVRWSVADPVTASIDSVTGVIVARAPGITRVTASTPSLADSAILTVLGPPSLALVLDTIPLLPGDTFTARVVARGPDGQGVAVTYAGGDPAVASISATGHVLAVAPGRALYTVSSDTLTATGIIDVLAPGDTSTGHAVIALSGALRVQHQFAGRWWQHPDSATGSLVWLELLGPGSRRLWGALRDSLAGPGTRTIGPAPAGTASACDPTAGWLQYADPAATPEVLAQSEGGAGAVRIQRRDPIEGGYRISATIDAALALRDAGGGTTRVALLGRYVGALVSLPACPADESPPGRTRPGRR